MTRVREMSDTDQLDGIDVHEPANFEATKSMDLLQRLADRMAGREPGAPTQ